MTDPRSGVLRAWPAWLWLALVLGLAWHQCGFWRDARIDTDVLALLPGDSQSPLLQRANAQLAQGTTGQVVVALGAEDADSAGRAAAAFLRAIADSGIALQVRGQDSAALAEALAYYGPQRSALLTAEQRQWLATKPTDATVDAALRRLYQPGPSGAGITSWQDDPLGLWPQWWQQRAGSVSMAGDGALQVARDGRLWRVLRFDYRPGAFRLDGERHLLDALDAARAAALSRVPDVQVLRAGVPLHAELAAAQASREVGTIGLGSLCAVLLLMWLAFRGPRPLLLVSASLLIGCAAGVSATALLFGQVHVLTLVFGASLVGVAEDYGIHYFCARQAHPASEPRRLMQQLLPGLVLALLTSVLAYLALGAAPFPGLRQMAVFSATGLVAAFLTAVFWFPWLDRRAPRSGWLGQAIASSLSRVPRLQGRGAFATVALLLVVSLAGIVQLRSDDSLRSLHHPDPSLRHDEQALGELLGLPSPAQYFVVEGRDAAVVLEREEALVDALRAEVEAGRLHGWQALSDWLPSPRRQQQHRDLLRPLEQAARARAARLLDEPLPPRTTLELPLQLEDWLGLQIAAPLRALWLEPGSVVLLQGVDADTDLAALQRIAAALDGVQFVDRSAGISRLLQHYRHMISLLLLAGYIAVALVLAWRYRRAAWRALLPTVLAAVFSLGMLGWLGEPLQLFSVLAQLLLLGIGVDYGIFLLEHRDDASSWLAVTIGAISTWLAFGLLGLSATPALHSFGLSLMIGIAAVWLLSPLFRIAPSSLSNHPPGSH